MPPQRAILRQTASAAPDAAAPGSAAVSSIATGTAHAGRAPRRSAATPCTGSSAYSSPAGASARRLRERLADVAQAPLASTRIAIARPGRGAHRGDAARRRRPTPTLTLTQPKPAAAAAAARGAAAVARSSAPSVALTGTAVAAPAASRCATGRPVAPPRAVPEREVDRGERLRERSRSAAHAASSSAWLGAGGPRRAGPRA